MADHLEMSPLSMHAALHLRQGDHTKPNSACRALPSIAFASNALELINIAAEAAKCT